MGVFRICTLNGNIVIESNRNSRIVCKARCSANAQCKGYSIFPNSGKCFNFSKKPICAKGTAVSGTGLEHYHRKGLYHSDYLSLGESSNVSLCESSNGSFDVLIKK